MIAFYIQYIMKHLIKLLWLLLVIWVWSTVYVNPVELDLHFKEWQKIDAQIEQLAYNVERAKSLQPMLRWEYNLCLSRQGTCLKDSYAKARGNDNFIVESWPKLVELKKRQAKVWLDFNECKAWRHHCDKKPAPKPVATSSTSIEWLINIYADKYWVSRVRAKRIAYCESKYNRCAKYPYINAQCTQSERAVNCTWRVCSTAAWIFQFTNATRDEYRRQFNRAGASKYNAEANIEVAMWMMWRWMYSRRVCK